MLDPLQNQFADIELDAHLDFLVAQSRPQHFGKLKITGGPEEQVVDCFLDLSSENSGQLVFIELADHAHDFAEMLCFIGGNPEDITDFGAEIEMTLGEEGEVYKINETAVVAMPAGLMHCPIVFKKVTKPIVFLEISLTRIWKPTGTPDKPPEDK